MVININGAKELLQVENLLKLFFCVSLGLEIEFKEDDELCEKNLFIDNTWAVVLLVNGKLDVSNINVPEGSDVENLGVFDSASEVVECIIDDFMTREKANFLELTGI